MIHPRLRTAACVTLTLIAAPSHALSPEQVFAKASRSIVVVQVFGARNSPVALGSGVVVAAHEVVTNCHVISAGTTPRVLAGGQTYDAKLIASDVAKDLCLLRAPRFAGSPAEIRSAKGVAPGARVFAIGAPRGLELTISEGLASGLRAVSGGTLIQTSAAIAPGSSGGGLFDDSGRLIGITSFVLRDSQSIGFALPADWIGELKSSTTVMAASVKATLASSLNPGVTDDEETRRWVRKMQPRIQRHFPDDESARHFLALVRYEAMRAGLDPHLVLSMIAVLSDFRKYQVAPAGAMGLMQVNRFWIGEIGAPGDNLFTERTNLRYGCVIFRYYMDKHGGNVTKALSLYSDQATGHPEGFSALDSTFSRQVLTAWRKDWALDTRNP